MKNIVKSAAAVVLAGALLCASGCSDTKWSFKTDSKALSNGVWIYYTFEGVSDALAKVQETDEKATLDSIDFEKDKIENKIAKDWAYAEAKKKELRYLTLDKLAADLKAEVTDESYNAAKSMYSSIYKSYYSEMFEKLGVSEESYCQANAMPGLLSDAVFEKIYGKAGTKEVSDKDVEAYFVDNYVSYYYTYCDLTTSTDASSESSGTVEAAQRLDAETIAKYQENMTKYANMLNNGGKTTDDVTEEYKKDFNVETALTASDTTPKSNLSTTNEVYKAILDAAEGKAFTKEINDKLYMIYRFDIKEKAKDIKSNDDATEDDTKTISRETVVKNMKSEEFNKYLDEEQKNLKYTRNDACIHKYDVLRTVSILKGQG